MHLQNIHSTHQSCNTFNFIPRLINKIKTIFSQSVDSGVGFEVKPKGRYDIKIIRKRTAGFKGLGRKKHIVLLGCVGNGSNATVDKARVNDKIDCVIKRLHTKKAGARDFYYEAKHLKKLTELGVERIPKYIGSGLDQHGRPFLAMEICDENLANRVKDRALYASTARKYMQQILEGVQSLHKNGIVHQDLKSENILLKGDEIKIGDLGEAKKRKSLLLLDKNFQLGGTPDVHSPEYDSGRRWKVSRRSDLWSVGLIGLEMVFGMDMGRQLRTLFSRKTTRVDQDLVDTILQQSFDGLPDEYADLVKVIKGFLTIDIDKRMSICSAQEILSAEELIPDFKEI